MEQICENAKPTAQFQFLKAVVTPQLRTSTLSYQWSRQSVLAVNASVSQALTSSSQFHSSPLHLLFKNIIRRNSVLANHQAESKESRGKRISPHSLTVLR
jgi:hypothetical protein